MGDITFRCGGDTAVDNVSSPRLRSCGGYSRDIENRDLSYGGSVHVPQDERRSRDVVRDVRSPEVRAPNRRPGLRASLRATQRRRTPVR